MIRKKIYEEKTATQKVWYDSSMIVYTEMIEDPNENCGDLYVVFKNGTRYKYSKVKFEDYVVFVGGGTDASQGKTLNKVIKGKYDYERLSDVDLNAIEAELVKYVSEEVSTVTEEEKPYVFFISGHRDITRDEFEFNYVPAINKALHDHPNAKFIVGDYYGADIMAQDYLMDVLMLNVEDVTVYHMMESPRNINPSITQTVGGFQTDDERDSAMTADSDEDIAFVRNNKVISGTAENILRRHSLKTF